MSTIDIRDARVAYGAVTVLHDLNLSVDEGEFLVLLGSSGCGKSTLLNAIAGLTDLTDGQIFIGKKNVTWSEPKDRGIGMVFQSYALYPRMTVEENMSFGLRIAGMPKADVAARVARAAGILKLEQLLKRRPSELSGGQRQRVAIGRALVRDVEVFLFDEPLSNLDAKLRTELRVEIKRLHQELGNTMIYVTHDQIEAMTLADRIAVMRDGRIEQLESPEGIYARPANRFVAGFIGSPGMNFTEASIEQTDQGVRAVADDLNVDLSAYRFAGHPPDRQRIEIGYRPEHLLIGDAAREQPLQAKLTVEVTENMGADLYAWGKVGASKAVARLPTGLRIAPGSTITIGVPPEYLSVFDAATGDRL